MSDTQRGPFPGPFMKLPPLPPGYVWNDAAATGEPALWVMVPAPADWCRTFDEICRDGDRLFGYDRREFIARQYRHQQGNDHG